MSTGRQNLGIWAYDALDPTHYIRIAFANEWGIYYASWQEEGTTALRLVGLRCSPHSVAQATYREGRVVFCGRPDRELLYQEDGDE